MKKMIAFTLSALMALSMTACGTDAGGDKNDVPIPSGVPGILDQHYAGDSNSVQIPTPFTEYASLDEAVAAAGFPLTVPDSINGYSEKAIQVFDTTKEKMIQVIYRAGDGGNDNDIHIRKAFGTGDISGDYNRYAENNTVTIKGHSVTTKGDNGQICLATWVDNGYTYSISVRSEAGISSEAMTDLIAAIQ